MADKRYFISLLWVLLFIVAKAQTPISFTSDQGLSNTRIYSIAEDSRKNIWICTQGGLNRYDGAKMNVYRHKQGEPGTLGHDMVTCVLELEPGCVLVGMETGVQAYDYDTDSFSDVPLLDGNGSAMTAHVISMSRLSNGQVYVCTAGFGVYRLERDEDWGMWLERAQGLPQSGVLTQMHEDRKGRLWILESGGTVYCRVGKTTRNVARCPGGMEFCESSSGRLYLGTVHDGLLCYSEEEHRFVNVSPESRDFVLASVTAAPGGRILMATDGNGLQEYDERTGKTRQSHIRTYEYDVATSNVKDALVDSEGNTWVGVFWKGVLVMPHVSSGFMYVGRRSVQKNTIGTNCVTAIAGDGHGDLWLATDHCGLYHLSADGSRSEHFKPGVAGMPATVMSILLDSGGGLWLGSSWSGVVRMDPATAECTDISAWAKGGDKIPNAYALAEDSHGHIWIGTNGNGLFRYEPGTHVLKHFSFRIDRSVERGARVLHNVYIMSLLACGDSLYVGTADGLEVLRITAEGLQPVGRYLQKNIIRTMKKDGEGVLWVGTALGLARLPGKGGAMRIFTEDDGLPGNSICSIEMAADGKVWVGTDEGLARFSPADSTFESYRFEDGLQGNEFSVDASYAQGGLLYFGGINGLTYFRSSEVERPESTAKLDLRMVDFYVNGKPVHVGDRSGSYSIIDCWFPLAEEVHLSHHDRSFAIEVSTMGSSNRSVTYYYSVNGKPWTALEPGQNRIPFINMDTGTYYIRVKAEAYGESSGQKALTVVLHPAWYFSPIAICAYVLLLLLGGFVAWRQVQEHFRAKRLIEEHRQREKLNEARIQFFMNISHEIRTPMTLIVGPLMKLMKMDKGDEVHQRNYSLIYQNAQRILRLINQLMDVRKIEKGQFSLKYGKVELVGFVQNLYDLFEAAAHDRGIKFRFVHKMKELPACVDPQNFDKVVMNLLSNAFKFTPDGGAITIELKEAKSPTGADEWFELSVTDTGSGISAEEKVRVFERFYAGRGEKGYFGTGIGLNLTRSLVEMHRGTICLEDSPAGTGARFVVRMPRALGRPEYLMEEEQQPNVSSVVERQEEWAAAAVDGDPAGKGGKAKAWRLVLVEDDVSVRRYLHGELSDKFHVEEFGNGQDAHDYVVQNAGKVDLVLSDVMMPGMDGVELCRRLKANFNTGHIPVVLLTAKSGDADRLEGLSVGADAYLTKPFNMDILRQTVGNLLQARRRLLGKQEVVRREGEMEQKELESPNEAMMRRVMKVVNENISDSEMSVADIADKIGISRVHFYRRLKEVTGLTPHEFVRNIRLIQAGKLLASKGDYDITDVSVAVGFKTLSTFSTCFKAYYGMTPREYMKQKAQERESGDAEGA